MKYSLCLVLALRRPSRPVRALWIEMIVLKGMYLTQMSRPVRALWIEMTYPRYRENRPLSRPARALWIEMLVPYPDSRQACVEAREGLVD